MAEASVFSFVKRVLGLSTVQRYMDMRDTLHGF